MRVKYLPQDAEARLNNGICFYDGRPYHLKLLSQIVAELHPLYGKREPIRIETTDAKLDISSPELGYANAKSGSAVFVYRKPERKYKQLITHGSLLGFQPLIGHVWYSESIHELMYSKAGESLLLGQYPSLEEALTKVKEGSISSIAISRDIALAVDHHKEIFVFYKMDNIGILKGNIVEIPSGDVAWVISRYLEGFSWEVR